MVLAGHDDGGLLVAEALNEGEGFRVLGDVDLLVGDALLVEGAVGRVALGAAGLGVAVYGASASTSGTAGSR